MPKYLTEDVSDDYLQGLIAAYKAGQVAIGTTPPGSDQPIIDRLEACGVTRREGAEVIGRFDALPSDITGV